MVIQEYEYIIYRTEPFGHRCNCVCIISFVKGRRFPRAETDAVFSDGLVDTKRRISAGADSAYGRSGVGVRENAVCGLINDSHQLLLFYVQLLLRKGTEKNPANS